MKTDYIRIRCTTEEKEQLKEIARKSGQSLSRLLVRTPLDIENGQNNNKIGE